MTKYEGSLNINKMNPVEKKAYKAWKDQGQRCQNPNDRAFNFYGAKGVKRIYEPREFIAWFVVQYSSKKEWNRATVDRIDSNGNYEFGNIQLIELSENTKRRNLEHGNPSASKIVMTFDGKSGELLLIGSKRETERLTMVNRRDMTRSCDTGKSLRNGFSFKYCD